jgi:ankyrin repeat protein
VRLLAEKGANLSQKDGEYLTPLGYAIVNNNVPMLEYLLSKGVKSDEIIHQYEAIRHKNLSANMLVYLLNKGLNPDVLLQKAASINDITGIEVALNKGAKPDQVLYDALRYNWLQNRDKLIRLTIDKVDPTTVLLWATQFGDGQIAKDILKKNVDPNKKNENGETALFLALKNGLFDIVKDLVQNQKTDVLIKDKEGNTALILAVTKNAPSEVIQLLLNRGIKINEQNNEGNTALIVAVMNGNKETVSRLIGAGADVTLKNKNGATAHSFAITRGYGDLAKILEEAEKNMGR